MKRILSIFFLVVFLFQVGGYYIVFWGMQQSSKRDLLQRLDAEAYSQDDLVVLTIPFALPYPVIANQFERVDGEFEYQGENYKLVKQKLENDTLFIACIRDRETSRISEVFSEFSKATNNLPVNNKKAIDLVSKIYKDFKSTEFKLLFKSRAMYERAYFADASPSLTSREASIDSPPPELLF